LSKSSHRWCREHEADPYVKRAAREGYRARSAYKLIEIQEKDHILKKGMVVVDLGAAPGGWSQVASRCVGPSGRVIALDILPMEPIEDVTFIEGDFQEQAVLEALLATLEGKKVDCIICDIAPNLSGMDAIDQPRAMYLAELAMDFVSRAASPGASFLIKIFQGEGSEEYLKVLRTHFKRVVIRKPKASRPRSKEVYVLATDYTI
jgi:23S rRNA (uridine2552-2'-O)-methyltransferase